METEKAIKDIFRILRNMQSTQLYLRAMVSNMGQASFKEEEFEAIHKKSMEQYTKTPLYEDMHGFKGIWDHFKDEI